MLKCEPHECCINYISFRLSVCKLDRKYAAIVGICAHASPGRAVLLWQVIWIIKRVSCWQQLSLSNHCAAWHTIYFTSAWTTTQGRPLGRGSDGTRDTGGGNDGPVTWSKFRRLYSTISDVQGQLSSMKMEMSRERREADDRLVKRMKLQHTTIFAKKGNECQYCFNEDVKNKFQAAAAVLDVTPPDVEKAKALLKEGEHLVDKRQKLIEIADRSEHGRSTVEEYVEDELAEDSDDEKRLFRAESKAGH